MRTQDIITGKTYRHKGTPNYAYARVVQRIPPKTGLNTHSYTVFKCEWTIGKNDLAGFIKYFRATNLIPLED